VPDLNSVVILRWHRENKEEQGKVGHSRTRAVVLNLFLHILPFLSNKVTRFTPSTTYRTLFVKQGFQIYLQVYQIYPQYSMVVNLLIY